MVEMKIVKDNQEYPKSYFYLMGHAFGDDTQYTIEPLGRFGTPTEAEAHIDIINQDIKKEGGILANDEEFPFLILEIVNVIMEDLGSVKQGETVKFFIYDWSNEGYTDIGEVSRLDCLGKYQERILGFLKSKRERFSGYNSTALSSDRLDLEDF